MSPLGRLFRRTPPSPQQSQQDRLLALASARSTLEGVHRLRPTGRAGVCARPLSSDAFNAFLKDLPRLLGGWGSTPRVLADSYGAHWVVLQEADFTSLLKEVQRTAQAFRERGFGDQLLVAVLPFRTESAFSEVRKTVLWIYHFRRGTFYPFIPLPGEKRDMAEEIAIADKMKEHLPIEGALEAWYPLWGIPWLEETP